MKNLSWQKAQVHKEKSMAQTASLPKKGRSRRDIAIGFFFLLVTGFILLLSQGTAGSTSTFVLTSQRGGVTIAAPDLLLPTATTLYVIAILVGVAGGWG